MIFSIGQCYFFMDYMVKNKCSDKTIMECIKEFD